MNRAAPDRSVTFEFAVKVVMFVFEAKSHPSLDSCLYSRPMSSAV